MSLKNSQTFTKFGYLMPSTQYAPEAETLPSLILLFLLPYS